MRRFCVTFLDLAEFRKYSYTAESRMERKICLNTPQEAEIQCGVPHLCGVLGLFFLKGFQSLAENSMWSSAWCWILHDAEFRMMRSSAWWRPPYDAEFRIMRNSARNSSMSLLLIPVCSVFPDLYDKKIRIIMVYLWLATELVFFV